MEAGITMWGADIRGRRHINGLAGLDVKVLTNTMRRNKAILKCSDLMDEMRTCMGVINGYYNKMPDVDTEIEIANLSRGFMNQDHTQIKELRWDPKTQESTEEDLTEKQRIGDQQATPQC